MDHCSSSYDSDALDDQPYHFSPAVDPEDVVCPGSDAEETPDQIEKKRQRYETAAQRFAKGQIPIILSASLKGPFSKESGWINPWRYCPSKNRDEDWWQPGSEDMLFTRANVMKRAAAHGLGYLTPADALKWCKATAQAEADAVNETNVETGLVIRSVERDDLDDLEAETEAVTTLGNSDQVSTKHRQLCSDLAPSLGRSDLSMLNHYSKTPHVDEKLKRYSRAMKRPAVSQWLKGSYVSKRARWEGPAIPSPTPLPDVLERDRRRQQLSLRKLSNRVPDGTRSSRLGISDVPKEGPQKHQLATFQTTVPANGFATQPDPDPLYSFSPDNRSSKLEPRDFDQLEDDVDELQDVAQENIYRTSSHRSSIKAKRSPINLEDRSFSDLEPDDLIVIASQTKPTSGMPITKLQSSRIQTPGPDPYDLPKLPRSKTTPVKSHHGVELVNEDSFITEVAPSSRNLEKFEFRKRKLKFVEQPKSEPQTPKLYEDAGAKTTGAFLELVLDDKSVDSRNADKEHLCSKSPTGEYTPARAPGTREKQSSKSESTPPESEESSWDMMEDITQTSSFVRAAKITRLSSSPKSKIPTVATPSMTPKKENRRSELSAKITLLTGPCRKAVKSQTVVGPSELSQYLHDFNTQSYNTTLPRSLPGPETNPESSLIEPPVHDLDTVALPNEEALDEMGRIQMASSQICPSCSHKGSPHSSQGHSFQDPIHYEDSETGIETQGLVSTTVEDNSSTAPILSLYLGALETTDPENLATTEILTASERVFYVDSNVRHPQSPFHPRSPFNTEPEEVGNNSHFEIENGSRPEISGTTSPIHADTEALLMSDLELNINDNGNREDTRPTSVHTPASEASWEGCGPQSPWAIEHLQELPTYLGGQREKELPSEERQDRSLDGGVHMLDREVLMDDQGWDPMERPCTPINGGIKPFKDFSTPTSSPERRSANLDDGSMNTQSLVDAAIRNPWMSTSKMASSGKSKKRVSFGILPSGEQQEACNSTVPLSPPPAQMERCQQDEDYLHDGTTVLSTFGKHFVAATRAKKFKPMLPETRGSQLDSSPAFGAQAEAFIAADREASTEQDWPSTSKQLSFRYLKTRSDANNNVLTKEHEESESFLINSFSLSPKRRDSNSNSSFANFNMDDALGEAGDFLEDWSVDAELKKAKEAVPSKRESTGLRRRKLFGLV